MVKISRTATILAISLLGTTGCLGVSHDVPAPQSSLIKVNSTASLTILPMDWADAYAASGAGKPVPISAPVGQGPDVARGEVEIVPHAACMDGVAPATGVSCVTFDSGGKGHAVFYRRTTMASGSAEEN